MKSAEKVQSRTNGRRKGLIIVTLALIILMVPMLVGFTQWPSGPKNGLVGTWRISVTPYNCTTGIENPPFAAMISFERGGTMTETTASPGFQPGQRSPGHGVWEKTGRNTYRAVSEAFILFATTPNPPVPGFPQGVQRITQTIQVTHDQFTSEASAEFFDVNGNLVVTLCTRARGNRMGMDDS